MFGIEPLISGIGHNVMSRQGMLDKILLKEGGGKAEFLCHRVGSFMRTHMLFLTRTTAGLHEALKSVLAKRSNNLEREQTQRLLQTQ